MEFNYVVSAQQQAARICLAQSKLGLICENLCSCVQEHGSRDNELINKVHSDSFSHFVSKFPPCSASAGCPQSITQGVILEFIYCQRRRLNTEHSATPAGDMQSVTAVITYLGWFIAGFDLERPVHTSVRNFVDLFYKQTNWQIPLISQSKTINNYVYPKHSMQIRCYIKNSWSAH